MILENAIFPFRISFRKKVKRRLTTGRERCINGSALTVTRLM